MFIPSYKRILNDLEVFLPSYDLVPPPTPAPLLSCQQVVTLSHSSCMSPVDLTDGRVKRRGGGGGKSNEVARKHGPLYIIQYSLSVTFLFLLLLILNLFLYLLYTSRF
jgi:hypothetical protein